MQHAVCTITMHSHVLRIAPVATQFIVESSRVLRRMHVDAESVTKAQLKSVTKAQLSCTSQDVR